MEQERKAVCVTVIMCKQVSRLLLKHIIVTSFAPAFPSTSNLQVINIFYTNEAALSGPLRGLVLLTTAAGFTPFAPLVILSLFA